MCFRVELMRLAARLMPGGVARESLEHLGDREVYSKTRILFWNFFFFLPSQLRPCSPRDLCTGLLPHLLPLQTLTHVCPTVETLTLPRLPSFLPKPVSCLFLVLPLAIPSPNMSTKPTGSYNGLSSSCLIANHKPRDAVFPESTQLCAQGRTQGRWSMQDA